MRCGFGFKETEIFGFAVMFDLRLKFSGSSMKGRAFQNRFSPPSICSVLRGGGQTQVCNSVVCAITVDVVDLSRWPYPVNAQPNEPVSRIIPSFVLNAPVSDTAGQVRANTIASENARFRVAPDDIPDIVWGARHD